MELGVKIRQARLAAGLSQRQLCGEEITRNMLSQIENGSARPSMSTLAYLAARLGKSISYFLEEEAVTSPNQAVMARAGDAWENGDFGEVLKELEDYRAPDPVFDREKQLMERLAALSLAEARIAQGRSIYAGELLDWVGPIEGGYCAAQLEHRRLLLLAKARPQERAEICRKLPGLDGELLLRARDALDRGDFRRSAALLESAEDREDPDWNFLRGEVYLAQRCYDRAAECYHRAEETYPEKTAIRLERCYREMEDYKQAYFYACKQR